MKNFWVKEECLVWDASTALGDTIKEKYESFWLFLYNINKENKISGIYCSVEIASFVATSNSNAESNLVNFLNSNLLLQTFHRLKFDVNEVAVYVNHLPSDTLFVYFEQLGLRHVIVKCVF